MQHIPFNRPRIVGSELDYIRAAIENGHLSSGGPFTARCAERLEAATGASQALLVHSCTAALELAALLLDIGPGDEVLMPSFTYVSTANAFVLRGATPVFVDIRADTLNLDESLLQDAVTERTRAIVPVHYAGVVCEMDAIARVAAQHGLAVIEDAAQAFGSTYDDRPAGSFAAAAALSFHETKNVLSGEGGALLVNESEWIERALILRDKGTDRQRFSRGEVDRYTWLDLGSSYGMSELNAAFLLAQLEQAAAILADRLRTWHRYHDAFAELEAEGRVRRPIVPSRCEHNAHMYYLLLADGNDRASVLEGLNGRNINAVFHYVPLHSSPGGLRFARTAGELPETDSASARLVRMPLWYSMPEGEVARVVDAVYELLSARRGVASA